MAFPPVQPPGASRAVSSTNTSHGMNVRLLYCPNPSYLQRGESRPGVADSKYCVVSDAFLRDEGFVGLNGSNEPQNPCKATPA